jgi:lipoprotein-anchoring transpeptidase ErfK/SrfK
VLAAAFVASGVPARAEPSQVGAAAVSAAVEAATKVAPATESKPSGAELKPDAATSATVATSATAPSPPAAVKPAPPPPPSLVVDIDLSKQRMTVTERGKVRHTWPVSSGREGYRTPTGTFRPSWMSRMWYSKQYDDAPMPYSIFFNGGIAVHGTQATGMLGRPASHGCVRLAPANAETLYGLVTAHGKGMTRIKVFGTAPEPAVASPRQRPGGGTQRSAGYGGGRGYDRPRTYYAPPRHSAYGSGYGSYGNYGSYAPPPRYIYPGDPVPYGYRAVRPPYPPYGGSRVYYTR